ncbi:RNA polymerase sigma-70 factor (ECF subfamily) [Novosphingobium sp. GV055]|nr:RNA polymerase sigma-70 factor (ECF subfamily) [Novosphingobium sp. GV055]PUB05071.1 RNA polymerase sigma-70 factor (ECF subfamily) [Novosphingobium sp. GV061]PUB21390.1 RNA polymerase sigma-70 factor (ECF subfamily) [Novosphingobium sp. GV079]PUB43116.1 RNA polymerase sigma-70 factor (ECF subfamily) [Novosphingobium sp. GV027]
MEDGTGPDLRAQLERRRALARWVAQEIMPHEPRLRAWFVKRRIAPDVVDELMQDAYCRIAMLDTVDHIDCGHAYFFSICRNLLARRLKRQLIAPFEAISEIESYRDTGMPTPEEQVATRMAFERVRSLLAQLPERCRRIVELRKFEGWSQKEIAAHMGMTEKAVEKQVWVGVRAIREGWDRLEREPEMLPTGRRAS